MSSLSFITMPGARISFLILFLFLLVVVGIVFLIVFLMKKNKGTNADEQQGACGQCGYSVVGLTGFDCPECGSDLRQVGIVKPNKGGPTIAMVVLITVLVMFSCVCLGVLFWQGGSSPPAFAPTPRPVLVSPSDGTTVDEDESAAEEISPVQEDN